MSSFLSSISLQNLRRRFPAHDHPLPPYTQDKDDILAFNLDVKRLTDMVKYNDYKYIDQVGGFHKLADLLRTSMENGIRGHDKYLDHRRLAFDAKASFSWNMPRHPVNQNLFRFLIVNRVFFLIFELCPPILFGMVSKYNIEPFACVFFFIVAALQWKLFMQPKILKDTDKLLNEEDALQSKVVRDGRKLQIPPNKLVVGDLVLLKEGEKVPTDGVCLRGEETSFMTCGNTVVDEEIRMLVTSDWEHTKFGEQMSSTRWWFFVIFLGVERMSWTRWLFNFHFKNLGNKTQTPESEDTIVVSVVNENDTRFSQLSVGDLGELVKSENYDCLSNKFGGVGGIIQSLHSHEQNGIKGDASDLIHRRKVFGSNTFKHGPLRKQTLWGGRLFKVFLTNPCFNVWFPTVITLGIKFCKYGPKYRWFFGSGFSALALWSLTVWIVHKKILKEESKHAQVQVVRNGEPKYIPLGDVVVGDIILLTEDNLIPADGLFVNGDSLLLETGPGMIGESKDELPFVLVGSKVFHGCGRMLVTAVGGNTSSSVKIHLSSGIHKPLQADCKKLLSYAECIGWLSVVVVPLLVLVNYKKQKPTNEDTYLQMLSTTFVVLYRSILSIVGMTGTPLTDLGRVPAEFARQVAAFLGNASPEMFNWLAAGRVTTIIIDELSMQEIVEFRLNAEIINNVSSEAPSNMLEELRRGMVTLCGISDLVRPTEGILHEQTLLDWGMYELGINKTELMQTYDIEDSVSENELIWTRIKTKHDVERAKYVHCRGDAEMLLSRCSDYYEIDGTKSPLDEVLRMQIKEGIQNMTSKNLLSIALASKHVKREVGTDEDNGGSSGAKDDEENGGPNQEANGEKEDGNEGTHREAEGGEMCQGGSSGKPRADEDNGGAQVTRRKLKLKKMIEEYEVEMFKLKKAMEELEGDRMRRKLKLKKMIEEYEVVFFKLKKAIEEVEDDKMLMKMIEKYAVEMFKIKKTLEEVQTVEDVEENGLTLLGIIGLGAGQRKNVELLQKMGVNVKMVSSGSDISKVTAVAKRCGILAPTQKEDEGVVDADDFERLTDEEEKSKLAKRFCVMVRATSTVKHHLVQYLKKNDEVVAVVGKGEDDVSALKEADVGFVVQSESIPVIKQRAEFLVGDDGLTTILKILTRMRWFYFYVLLFIQLRLVLQITVFIVNSATTYFSGVTHVDDFMSFLLDTVLPFSAISLDPPELPFLGIEYEYDEPRLVGLKKLSHCGRRHFAVFKVIMKKVIIQDAILTAILLFLHFCEGDKILGITKNQMMGGILAVSQYLNITILGLWRKSGWTEISIRVLFIIQTAMVVGLCFITMDHDWTMSWIVSLPLFATFCGMFYRVFFYKHNYLFPIHLT